MSYGIIYCAYNKENGKRYIGQTIKSLAARKQVHYSKYSNCKYFSHALQKYPKDVWEWSIIDTAETREELNDKEKFWIQKFFSNDAAHGYNLTEGGQGSQGVVVSEESKLKTRETMLIQMKNNYSRPESPMKPVRCIELNKCFSSFSEAARMTGANVNSIRRVIKGELHTAGGYHWELLSGEERLKLCKNAIYCVELNKFYDNVRQARLEDRFHEGNLGEALKQGDPKEPKHYAGHTFYWVNPEFH